MAWPVGGSDGWEDLGTLELTEELPLVRTLPVDYTAVYYDPSPLLGIGSSADAVVLEFGATTVRAVRRAGSVEATLRAPEVYGVGLLDSLILPPIFPPCAVVLTIFDDDRVTELWSVGTNPDHAHPYLEEPDRYSEQELDVATCSAVIGTVTGRIVDKAQIPGDQDSGYVTGKLAKLASPDLAGRRAQMIRYANETTAVVLADGPAGTPKLLDFAGFELPIRDTRETERKIQIFGIGGGLSADDPGEDFGPNGAKTLLPDAVVGGYGLIAGTYLIDPATPLLGRFVSDGGSFYGGTVDLTATPGNASGLRALTDAAYRTMEAYEPVRPVQLSGGMFPVYKRTFRFANLAVLWRAASSGDPWTELGPSTLQVVALLPNTNTGFHLVAIDGTQHATTLAMGDTRGASVMPSDGQDIELMVLYRGLPTEDLPVYVEGITAGEFLRNIYDGRYSARAADGSRQPTGILYDESALLQMTDVMRLRITEPITDTRSWTEKMIYGPTGWVPALDSLGRISPLYQGPPDSTAGLPVISAAIAEASTDWNAGERIINVIRYTYPRDYKPDGGIDTTPRSRPRADKDTADQLSSRPVILEFEDSASVLRFGRQVLEIDGSAFRAVGLQDGSMNDTLADAEAAGIAAAVAAALRAGNELLASILRTILAAFAGLGNPEPGLQLAADRAQQLLNRYSLGAPTMQMAVMRRALPNLRAGDWATLDLPWMPDYVTGRRGLIALAQVTAIGDLDCAWRQVTVEVVTPFNAS